MDVVVKKEGNDQNYSRVNGCSRKPTGSQIIGLILASGYLALHLSILYEIMLLQQPLLVLVLVFSGVFAVMISIDYVLLLWIDPADSYLGKSVQEIGIKQRSFLIWCGKCKENVHRLSYHCQQCGRCVSEVDHHCFFVNNCIGRKNYSVFIRVILSLLAYVVLTLSEGVWLWLCGRTGWRVLLLIIISVPIIPWLVYLIVAHCYSVFRTYKEMLELQKEKPNEKSKVEVATGDNFLSSGKRVVIFPSGQRLKESGKSQQRAQVGDYF